VEEEENVRECFTEVSIGCCVLIYFAWICSAEIDTLLVLSAIGIVAALLSISAERKQ
jgi:hypothetical protein